MKPLDKVAGMSVLKNCGVRKVFKYSRAEPPPPHAATAPSRLVDIESYNDITDITSINLQIMFIFRVYMMSSSLPEVRGVLEQLRATCRASTIVPYVVFVPKVRQKIAFSHFSFNLIDTF